MAYTQQQIDDLRASLAKGVVTVKHGQKLVQYASLDDMREQLRIMEQELAGTARRPNALRSTNSKGL